MQKRLGAGNAFGNEADSLRNAKPIGKSEILDSNSAAPLSIQWFSMSHFALVLYNSGVHSSRNPSPSYLS